MPKILLHNPDARRALARGVLQLANAVEPTLGPKGMNTMIDRPIGTPLITRDGVSIAMEIELPDRFENMGAQVVREVSLQTNEIVGDGTTTAVVLANALIQRGVEAIETGVRMVDLCQGIDRAVDRVIQALQSGARPVAENGGLSAVANIAATDPGLGALVADAYLRVGADGIITTEFSVTTETVLFVAEGMSFDRGYLSHHMVTHQEKMEAVLESPLILITDLKIRGADALDVVRRLAADQGRPLFIIAEEVAPEVIVSLLGKDGPGRYLIVHPPEYGHWRKAMMEDIAILTGGRVVARDLGGDLTQVTLDDLGSVSRVRSTAGHTVLIGGAGAAPAIEARRVQVQRQYDLAPPNIEQDKLRERLAKLSGGSAVIYAGGATPVEQRRTAQLIEDSLHAVRAAIEGGVVAGGGTALAQIGSVLDPLLTEIQGDAAKGVRLVQTVLTRPLWQIVTNAGGDAKAVVAQVCGANSGFGYNAALGSYQNMFESGIIDPVRVTCTALKNAASVAKLILTTETLVANLPEGEDPTAVPARGGGAERL